MKKILFFLLIIPMFSACNQDKVTARDNELCFAIRGEELIVTNSTSKTVHVDVIDSSILSFISRMPFNCQDFRILEAGESVTLKMDDLLKNGRKPLSLTWWQCEGGELVNPGNKELPSTKNTTFCTGI